MNQINFEYHKYVGYLLAPIRLILFIGLYLLMFIGIPTINLFSRKYSDKYGLLMNYLSTKSIGLNIKIEGKENISNKRKIIVANHIHIFDYQIIIYIFNNILSFVATATYNIYPFRYLLEYSKCIIVDVKKKNGTVNKIKEHIKNNDLVIFPDACNIIPINYNISPFKRGAFIPKEPIQPVLIRYVPSSNTKVNINNNSFINHLMYSLADGHMDIYVKILPLEEYKEEYKSYEKYQEIIYNKMSAELRLLPNQYPPRIMNQESSSRYGMIKLLNFPFTLGLINTFLGNYYEASHQLLLFIVGYFCHFYYTNNTYLIDELTVITTNYLLTEYEIYNEFDYFIRNLYFILLLFILSTNYFFSCIKIYNSYYELYGYRDYMISIYLLILQIYRKYF